MKSRLVGGLAAASLWLIACASQSSPPAPAPSPVGNVDGFRAVGGATARGFRVPADMIPVARFGAAGKSRVYTRYQQLFGGAQVAGGQITVQQTEGGDSDLVIGGHFDSITPSNTVTLTEADAISIATTALPEATARTAALMIEPKSGRYYYAVDSSGDALRHVHWIDAQTGAIFNDYDALTTSCNATPGGVGFNSDQFDLASKVTFSGTSYTLATARQTTRDLGSQKKPFYGTGDQDADGCYDTAGRTSPGSGALVSAHVYVMNTDQYYLDHYAFDLASHTGGTLTVWAHKDVNYNNAFWDGSKMNFGDGDGVTYNNFTANDVAAHELSHGVTQFTSNLTYQNESGALNESFSDIMGMTIGDPTDWLMGEEVTKNGQGFRDLANPKTHGDPDNYCDRYTGTNDNGGVHTNSTISSHAFYLVAQTLGLATASDLFFHAYTGLPSDATFLTARSATEAAATALDSANAAAAADASVDSGTVAPSALAAVQSAWDAVKVGANITCTSTPQCTSDADCNDNNSCTADTCTSGVCSHVDNGTCTCKASGATCTAGSDCCSGSCTKKGKKGYTCN